MKASFPQEILFDWNIVHLSANPNPVVPGVKKKKEQDEQLNVLNQWRT